MDHEGARHHVALDTSDSRWTSQRAYAGLEDTPTWLTTDELLGLFGSRGALCAYVRDMADGLVKEPDGFDPRGFWRACPNSQPRPVVPRLDTMEAVKQVASVMGVEDALMRRSGRQPATGRRLSAWWLSQSTDLSMVAIGDVLGVSRPRARQLMEALRRQASEDASARSWMQDLMFPLSSGPR